MAVTSLCIEGPFQLIEVHTGSRGAAGRWMRAFWVDGLGWDGYGTELQRAMKLMDSEMEVSQKVPTRGQTRRAAQC